MESYISLFFDRGLKLHPQIYNKDIDGNQYNELYCWTDDHWYDLLFLLGERYTSYGWFDDITHQFVVCKIFDQKNNAYLNIKQQYQFIKNCRFIKSFDIETGV
jgi:hypothetical protein